MKDSRLITRISHETPSSKVFACSQQVARDACGIGLLLVLLVSISCNGRGNGTASVDRGIVDDRGTGEGWTEAEWAKERERMVVELAAAKITDKRVLHAMRRVPRHEFVPAEYRSRSYQNSELPIAEKQTISPPYIVAWMTQLLQLQGAEKVLEIGTGSGYQAAILGEMVPDGKVYTVEIRPALAEKARAKLDDLRRRGALGTGEIEVVAADGARGYPAGQPYDAILVTAAPRTVPEALREQLEVGGRLVIPVGDYSCQELQLIRRLENGAFEEQVLAPAAFVPLRQSAGR